MSYRKDQLDELLTFSESNLMNFRVNYTRIRNRKLLLLAMVGASHHFAQAIADLVEKRRMVAAQALVRTLYENWVNANYIFVGGRDQTTVKRFLGDDTRGLARNLAEMKKVLAAYPKLDSGFLSNERLDELSSVVQARINAFDSRYPGIAQMPNLHDRTVAIDSWQAKRYARESEPTLKWHYLVVYKYFCDVVHLGTQGLNRFLYEVSDGVKFALNGNFEDSDFEMICRFTGLFHADVLRMTMNQFEHPNRQGLHPIRKHLAKD